MYFPFFIDITDKSCIIVGGGNTALRKAEILSQFGVKIKVVAPEIKEEFKKIKNISLFYKKFEKEDMSDAFMAIGAADNREVNRLVYECAVNKNIPVNVVDDIDLCTFIFPSIVKDRDVVCGISSGGKSPLITQRIKRIILKNMDKNTGLINDRMGEIRSTVKEKINSEEKRKVCLKKIENRLFEAENNVSDIEIENIISEYFK